MNYRFHSPTNSGLSFCIACLWLLLCGWGFSSHRCIHDAAIQALPEPLHAYFKDNRSWLVAHAVDADLRKHAVVGESEKHFIDLDLYGFHLDSLRSCFPRDRKDAISTFGDSMLTANGTGPWNAIDTYYRLVDAFSEMNQPKILRYASDLGHYVADLHVPLHTTSNYNGAQTGQQGIHSLWETQLPEQFIESYNLTSGVHPNLPKAHYLKTPHDCIWQATFDSHHAVDSVLYFEDMLSRELGNTLTHAYIERGRTQQRMRSREFTTQYHQALNGQVERRMQRSIHSLSSLWYSAWVNAGQPNLPRSNLVQDSRRIERFFNWIF